MTVRWAYFFGQNGLPCPDGSLRETLGTEEPQ
nr:MAG TPA: hypothetical protein [Caudoviricetes sp.]